MNDVVPAAPPGLPVERPAPPAGSRGWKTWRFVQNAAVFLFVCWNLFFFALRNPLDLWWDKSTREWASEQSWWPAVDWWFTPLDTVTRRYGNVCGIEQGWWMFQAPLARSAPYLAAELAFDDGTSDLLLSTNEFPQDACYVRGWTYRLRKLEDQLVRQDPETLARYQRRGDGELTLWEAYTRHAVRRWRQAHPDDRRQVVTVRLLRRRRYFPTPDQDPKEAGETTTERIGTFTPDGTLLPDTSAP
jgi:hypothetical protein